MTQFIGISGRSGAGKDTLAQALSLVARQSYHKAVPIMGLADPLRQIAAALGYPVFDRRKKELTHIIGLERFEDLLFDASESIIGDVREELKAETFGRLLEQAQAEALNGQVVWSPRQFCQNLGSAGSATNLHLWVGILMHRAKEFDTVIVPDVRFPFEREICDPLVYVNAVGATLPARTTHESDRYYEELAESADFQFTNDHSIPVLTRAGALHTILIYTDLITASPQH